ncbi:hypothetical protein LCGC14_1609600 [marine sediment metagenome]|uniref:Uncharacterized protein n=1 Tax=marine sediment metagenome TaxID=412755 RepID=A0A0F9L922_9ZZZZ
MAKTDEAYVVLAKHYAQYLVVEEEERDGPVEVEILDEDDFNEALVAVRDTLKEAEKAATEWIEGCSSTEEDGIEHQPIAAVNIYRVPRTGPARPGRWIKDMWT